MTTQVFDAAVIGGGPAGLSAALWLARYRRRVLLFDSGDYRNERVDRSHGYLGLDPAAPAELRARGREELLRYPTAKILEDRVGTIGQHGDVFTLGAQASRVDARRIVLATGVRDLHPSMDGFSTHYGADVFHCPSCDGYEARDRHAIVLGWGAQVTGFALQLRNWARSVTIVTDQPSIDAAPEGLERLQAARVEVVVGTPQAFVGDRASLEEVVLADGRRLPATIGFFTVEHRPNAALADELGCERDGDGYICVDAHGQTSVPGVYAAGDCIPGVQLIQVAAGEGAIAGVGCAESL